MNEVTRSKAVNALVTAKPSGEIGGEFFGKVFVVGTEIYFTLHAAERAQCTHSALFPREQTKNIEIVTIAEALEARKDINPNGSVTSDDQTGSLYPGKLLFNPNNMY